jgi:hypothetical protein
VGKGSRIAVVLGVLATGAACLAVGASCSYGNYDGGYEGGGPTSATDGGDASTTRTVDPSKNATISTDDGVLQIGINAGTFDGPATIVMTATGEQTLENGLIVPIYEVTGPAPKQPIVIVLTGNGNSNLPMNRAVVVSAKQGDGTFAPLKLTGVGNQGGVTNQFWGATTTFGVFSLAFVSGTAILDIAKDACTANCCPTTVNSAPIGSLGTATFESGACFCGGTAPDLDCVLKHCGDLDAAAARCVQLGLTGGRATPCNNPTCAGGGNCGLVCTAANNNGNGGSNGVCCIQGNPPSNNCALPSPGLETCSGVAVHCTKNADCVTGTCCLVGKETLCAATCPDEARICENAGECADAGYDAGPGGPCRSTTACPFNTCGQAPAACK